MNKKCKKNKTINKSKKQANIKLVCPLCYKNKKGILLDDGYVVCAYCGMVVLKPKYSLEQIDAPGFIKIDLNKKNNEYDKANNKHHNLVMMNEFIKQFSTSN